MNKAKVLISLIEDMDNSGTNPLQGSLYNWALNKRFGKFLKRKKKK